METMLIELRNEKAARLLKELEALDLIKVLQKNPAPPQGLAAKYAGSLTPDVADDMQQYVNESRSK